MHLINYNKLKREIYFLQYILKSQEDGEPIANYWKNLFAFAFDAGDRICR